MSSQDAKSESQTKAVNETRRVNVPLGGRSYDIEIGTGRWRRFPEAIQQTIPDATHLIIIADNAVEYPWVQSFVSEFGSSDLKSGDLKSVNGGKPIRISRIGVPSGESSKSIDQFDQILQMMLQQNSDRKSVVVAIGGGVIGDLAGFAAASFTRGIRFIQIPTTLLAMVDSSVGGKTGINLPGAKNMVGAFWQPLLVLIDTEVLSTLPERSYVSGLAEVVKYGVIDDAEFFAWLESNAKRLVNRDADAVEHAVLRSCRSKASVVGEDERETSGRRAILNYGHTFAHAIEATCGYGKLLHGEAVSIGMQMAARLAIKQGLTDQALLDRQTQLLLDCDLPTTLPDADAGAMLPVMMKDKKVAHGKLRFVLPTRIGHVDLYDGIDEAIVRESIEESR